jgi:hypothetical protein
MPRVRRRHLPAVVTHVVVRFVNGEFIMDIVDGAREEYLCRLDRALAESDWCLCWYCLMGCHVHLGMVAGEDPLKSWCARVHSGWSGWINRGGRRKGLRTRGPVVAERPTAELAAWLNLSAPSATNLVRRASVDDLQSARHICAQLSGSRDRKKK